MPFWEGLETLVRDEVKQREEEGCDVGGFLEKVDEARGDRSRLMAVYDELQKLPVRSDFPYVEPSGLEDIRAARPEGPRRLQAAWSEGEWLDKFHGAWLGRCAGCALGKPLENRNFMAGAFGNPGWKNVQLWFEGADAWPIADFTPEHSRAEREIGLAVNRPSDSVRGKIRFMEADDDIRYTVLGLRMLEEKGLAFDAWDIGRQWHVKIPNELLYTAERRAYVNFAQLLALSGGRKPDDWEMQLDWVRTHLNPYREWIGAQIRADGFAYGAAGNPELAAELAWRDASFSHVKNGIYGEMFAASMIAAAFVVEDAETIVRIGLSEIPQNCRLARDIREAVTIAREAKSQIELVDRIWEAFKHYHPVHTNNNAALVAASLIFAGDDFEKAITTAVLGGWDTDCNGATVGSIMGAKLGAARLPQKWTAPFNDTLHAGITEFHPIAISECAKRSYAVFRKLQGEA